VGDKWRLASIEFRQDAVFVYLEQAAGFGNRFSGRCLRYKRRGKWGAYTNKPSQAAAVETSLAWLRKRAWRPW